jgi:hypothetical protein
MSDLFWLAVWLSIGITLVTVFFENYAYKWIVKNRALERISTILQSDQSDEIKVARVMDERTKQKSAEAHALVWGSELTVVAFSLDISCLGVWLVNPKLFPFFSRFNTTSSAMEIPVWLVLFIIHILLLLFALYCKQYHIISTSENIITARLGFGRYCFTQRWAFGANAIGSVALMISIIALMNAL